MIEAHAKVAEQLKAQLDARYREVLADSNSGYSSFVSTGNVEITEPEAVIPLVDKQPQMPNIMHRRAIPVALNTEVSRSRSFYGECFEPKPHVAVFPNFVDDE